MGNPGALLGQVAVDGREQGKGLGGILMHHVFRKACVIADTAGCHAIVLRCHLGRRRGGIRSAAGHGTRASASRPSQAPPGACSSQSSRCVRRFRPAPKNAGYDGVRTNRGSASPPRFRTLKRSAAARHCAQWAFWPERRLSGSPRRALAETVPEPPRGFWPGGANSSPDRLDWMDWGVMPKGNACRKSPSPCPRDEDGRGPAALAAGPMTASLVGSGRVRRHPHRRARSAPQCGVSRGPRACRGPGPHRDRPFRPAATDERPQSAPADNPVLFGGLR